MIYIAVIRDVVTKQTWKEEYDFPDNETDAKKIMQSIIRNFNNTLRPGENKRELVSFVNSSKIVTGDI